MADATIILVGYVPPALALLREFQPDGSIVLVEEPDIVRKRDVRAAAAESPLVAELIEWEYQLPGTADAFAARRPDLAGAVAVIPLVEYATPFAARLADRIGVPGATAAAAEALRNKAELRRITAAAGVPNPVHREVDGPDAVRAFLAEHPGPAILKPANRQAAVGTRVLRDPAEVDAAWVLCTHQDEGIFVPDRPMPLQMLVESYVCGHEYSVEMLVRDGVPVFANVTDKELFPGPYPVERGHTVPASLGAAERKTLEAATTDVLRATGFGTGIVHCEWIVTGDGTPHLVECAGRLPGDGIAELIERAYGFSLGRAYFGLMRRDRADQLPSLPADPEQYLAVRFTAGQAGEVVSITDLDEIRALPGVVSVSKGVSPGDTVRDLHNSWDRLALVMAAGGSAEEASALADAALGRLTVEIRPAAADDPVQVRRGEDRAVEREHGLELKLLHPWPGLTTPFQGAWCVLRPGDVSDTHLHHEHEIFIAMGGAGRVVTDDHEYQIRGGDLVFLRPGTRHHVVNDGPEDFSYYSVWWDRAMAGAFIDADHTPDTDEAFAPGTAS